MKGLKYDAVFIDEWKDFTAITVEQVTPAAVKGQDVEQQTEEGNVQLPTKVERES